MSESPLVERLSSSAKNAWRKGAIGGMLARVKGEPVLLVFHVERPQRAFAIQQSRLAIYVDEKQGSARPALVAKANEAAKHLGIDPLTVNINNIIDMVMFQAEDLRNMERSNG